MERERERGCKEARISFIETSGRFPNVGDNTSGEIQVWCIALGSIIIINDYVAVVVVVSASSNIVAHSHSHSRQNLLRKNGENLGFRQLQTDPFLSQLHPEVGLHRRLDLRTRGRGVVHE